MKWNIVLVLAFTLLLIVRFLIVDGRLGSDVDQQQIRIMPLKIEKRILKADCFDTEVLTLHNVSTEFLDEGRRIAKRELDKKQIIESPSGNISRENKKRIKPVNAKSKQENRDGDDQVQVSMNRSKPFVKEQDEFLPSDKIYISLVFPNLKAGKYHIVSHWKTPQGTIARKVVRNIDLKKDIQPYKVYFWFQLVENGFFTEMFTGAEYSRKVYGKWEVLFYLNDELIVTKDFILADI